MATLMVMLVQLWSVQVVSAYSGGDVVINEVAWAGSVDGSSDEWIELYNNTSQTIDLTGWYIEDDGSSVYEIQSGEIGPHGYFLIEDSEESVSNPADAVISISLANSGDSLALFDAEGNVMDTVNTSGGAWFAGNSGDKSTMEKIDPKVRAWFCNSRYSWWG